VLGSVLASVVSFRAAFVAAAALYLVCLVPLRGLATTVSGPPARTGVGGALPAGRPPTLLLAFNVLCALVLSGQTIRNTYLPLHVTTHLGGSVATFGTLMSVSPVVELVALPLAGLLAERIGPGLLIGAGLVIAAVEYSVVAASTALWQVYMAQARDACVVAVVLGLGLTYAQQLSPGRPGLASSIFFSAVNMARIVGGLLGSAGVPVLGIPHVFLLPALLCAVCAIAFVGIDRAGHARPAEPHHDAVVTAIAIGAAIRRARS
jgi:SET family sugar efflux transporter-like MFS transporter